MKFSASICALAVAGSALISHAEAAVFTVDPTQSSLTISGVILGFPFQQQFVGSLTTSYTGTIDASYTQSTIDFNSASVDAVFQSIAVQPGPSGFAGTAPGDYGAQANTQFGAALAALRDVIFDIQSGVINRTGNSFDSSQLNFLFLQGAMDYRTPFNVGRELLAGETATNASNLGALAISGNLATLTIPINATFLFDLVGTADTVVTVTGQFVATSPVPEPSTTLLASGGAMFLGLMRRRSRD